MMRAAGDGPDGARLCALIVMLGAPGFGSARHWISPKRTLTAVERFDLLGDLEVLVGDGNDRAEIACVYLARVGDHNGRRAVAARRPRWARTG